MFDQKYQRSTTPPNNIHSRITDIQQLLAKNNAVFPKGILNEEQLKQLLQHSYNCYDQLDFIYQDYARQAVNYLDPKAIADETHKILRSTKYLINHLRYWLDAYSVELFRKTTEVRYNTDKHSCTKPHCYLCLNNINEMKLK